MILECENCGKEFLHKRKIKTCSKECCEIIRGKNISNARSSDRVEIPDELRQIIDGELLGDAGLRTARKKDHGQAHFYYRTAREEYSRCLEKKFQIFGTTGVQKEDNNGFDSYFFRTLVNPTLTDFYHRWYAGENHQKIVPRDIELTPLVCKHWYLGDGNLKEAGDIILYTNGFTIEDVNFLIEKLNELGFSSNLRNYKDNSYKKDYPTIHISSFSTADFINYIGECPVEYYKYKWNIPQRCYDFKNYPYTITDLSEILNITSLRSTAIINAPWFPSSVNIRSIGSVYRFNKIEVEKIEESYKTYLIEENINNIQFVYSINDIANKLNIIPGITQIMRSKWFPKDITYKIINRKYKFDENNFNKIIEAHKNMEK